MSLLLWISWFALALISYALVLIQDKRHGERLSSGWLVGYLAACLVFWPAILFFAAVEEYHQATKPGGGE